MRRSYAVGSLFGALVVASACATSPGAFSTAQTQPSAMRQSASPRFDFAAFRDSLRAQAIADQEGPRVTVRAELSSFAASRRVRAIFHTEDDAYVVVGHLGPDGIVRIIFPTDPADNGFVQGGKTYRLPEIAAGFPDLYRWRTASYGLFRSQSARNDSYDAGMGYVFVIAAWRPMRFDRFAEGGRWNEFEVADEVYLRDPRPAIHELATLLTGENREAYTVKFANYFSTVTSYWGYGSPFISAFASAFCVGDEPFGYSLFGFTDPWGRVAFSPRGYSGYFVSGLSRYAYRYDAAQGCYRTYMLPLRTYADGGLLPVPPQNPYAPTDTTGRTRGRTLPIDVVRPRVGGRPIQTNDVGPGEAASPEYRRRGLVTDGSDERATRHDWRRPANGAAAADYARPAIQEMLNRRREMIDRSSGAGDPGSYRPTPRAEDMGGRQGRYMPPGGFDAPRREPNVERPSQPQTEPTRSYPTLPVVRPSEGPRVEPVRVEVRPPDAPRPAEQPRVESRPPDPVPVVRPPR